MPISPELDAPDEQPTEVKETSEESVLNKFVNLIADDKSRKIFTTAILSGNKRPVEGTNHNKPYYRMKYALQIKEVLDEIMVDKKPKIYRYSTTGLSATSLYLKISQAKEYLLDNLDPEGKYTAFSEALCIKKKYGVGVILSVRQDILDEKIAGAPDNFKAEKLIDDELGWRDKLEKFLEEGKAGQPFVVDNIALDADEQNTLEVQLCTLSNIVYSITEKQIKIVKTV